MIKGKLKQKLLKEIEKFGNVYLSCQKIGIDKATYYRWKESDEKFRAQAEKSEEIGRENIGEVAEYGLLQNIKEKNQRAIEFALVNISKKYKQDRTTNVIFMHKKEIIPNVPQRTLEDMLEDYADDRIANKTIGTADSKPETDKPIVVPQENQTPSDSSSSNSAIQDKKSDNNT